MGRLPHGHDADSTRGIRGRSPAVTAAIAFFPGAVPCSARPSGPTAGCTPRAGAAHSPDFDEL